MVTRGLADTSVFIAQKNRSSIAHDLPMVTQDSDLDEIDGLTTIRI